jgi:hypothetical protein
MLTTEEFPCNLSILLLEVEDRLWESSWNALGEVVHEGNLTLKEHPLD